MKYKITDVTATTIDVTYDDGAKATIRLAGDETASSLKALIATFATKTAFADASKVPLAKDFEGDTTTDNDSSKVPVIWTYGKARAAHYPHIGDQLDALYWNRQGDSTHLTRINESIADTKTKWPKTLADMTQAEYEAKVKELYG